MNKSSSNSDVIIKLDKRYFLINKDVKRIVRIHEILPKRGKKMHKIGILFIKIKIAALRDTHKKRICIKFQNLK